MEKMNGGTLQDVIEKATGHLYKPYNEDNKYK
jgi:hypothetical protein